MSQLTTAEAIRKLERYCAYQERCHYEVRSKLLTLKVYGDDLEEVMAHLVSENFLNEERFARSFVRGKHRLKQWGPIKILNELKKRHISDYCIRKGMEEISEVEFQNTLDGLLNKRLNNFQRRLSSSVQRNKLFQHARAKGYEPQQIYNALKTLDK